MKKLLLTNKMKKLFLIGLLLSTISINAQDFKKLQLTVKTNLSKEATVYLEPIDNDRLLLIDYFKSSLSADGFKVVTERKEATYSITIKYHHRSDTGCGGRVMTDMDGQVMDVKNSSEVVANFSFSQGAFGGKCTSDIMSALAKKIKESAK